MRRLSFQALSLLVALVFAACAGPGASPTPAMTPSAGPTAIPSLSAAPSTSGITFVDDEGATIALSGIPQSVVSLTPATTELLFALGVGDRLAGRTDYDDYPPEALNVPAVATFEGVNIEQVVDIEPDLVIAGGNNFTPADDVARLRELGVPVLVIYAQNVAGVLADIRLVGKALGGRYRGQRQKWFALRFTGQDTDIRLDLDPHPEFDAWRWARLAELPALAVAFKRTIYEDLAAEFARFAG